MKTVLIIGQAPPLKEYKVPFGGTRLYKWFAEVGINEKTVLQSFDFDALVNKFPGKNSKGHNIPSESEIQKHVPLLIEKIYNCETSVIVPVGKLAIQYVLNQEELELSEYIGKKFYSYPFGKKGEKIVIIPLPHPSGLSTWQFNSHNKQLLLKALELIKEFINL